MTPYEQVRSKIIEAVPEIMNLEFGCEVEVDDTKYKILFHEDGGKSFDGENTEFYGPVTQVITDDMEIEVWGDSFDATHEYPTKNKIKILGREITIADVLQTLPKYGLKVSVSAHYMYLGYVDGNNYGKHFDWDISHDSLSWHRDNRPEVIDFLAEILNQ